MSAIGKAALFLAAISSGLAMAQAPQASPAQKPSPATSASPAPAGLPRAQVSPYAQRLANSQSQLRANQPATPAQPAVRPVTPQPVIPRPIPVAQPRPVAPQPVQPATPAPVVAQPPVQPAIAQPAIAAPSTSNGPAAVDYSHGQLTVVSERATLGQVLKLVAAKTGGVIDVAPELQNEPVMARLGPGPAREVLTDLLDSPKIDYIVMGAGDKGLERIVVRTRQSFGRTAMAAIPAAQPQPQPQEEAKAQLSNSPVSNGATPAEAKLTQEQLMENWKKAREQMRVAEIQQQAEEREREQNHVQAESQPEQPTEPPPPGDNPPQR